MMKTFVWIRLLAVTALLAAACGTGGGAASGNPASSTPTASSSPTPAITSACPPPSNRCLALVTLRGSNEVVVRDITDINHPTTVGTVTSPSQFVTATDVSYVDPSGDLVRHTFASSSTTVVVKNIALPFLAPGMYDWSPDGTTVVYLTNTSSGMALHQVSGGENRTSGSVPALPTVFGCESQTCADRMDMRLAYSRDGRFISWVQTLNDPVLHLWASDGTALNTVGPLEAMSVWSGGSLSFRVAGGVNVWRDGVVTSFLPGVAWIRPKASPAGSQIVYSARDAQGWSHTYVVDTTTRNVREIKKARTAPVFLTSRYIWYQSERSCLPTDPCSGSSVIAIGPAYIYDLQDGTETESTITSVADVWPHAA
jgi:hypothetical protein